MTDVTYKAWYLIPVDQTPADLPDEGRQFSAQPPMMGTMAVDAGSSLAFDLATDPQSDLHVTVTVTGLSAEGRGADAMAVYAGDSIDSSWSTESVTWERGQDAMSAIFRGVVSRPKRFIKLHVPVSPALVIAKVEFQTP